MFKTFIFGIILGIVGAGALLYLYPLVDQKREDSIVSVAPNGVNTESFHVNVPMDRILVGAAGNRNPLPAGLEWPSDSALDEVRVELFKIRNAKDSVVGVASRTAANNGSEDVIDWVLHLPARGSVFVNMGPDAIEGGYRAGVLRAGSREFRQLSGAMTERWVPNTSDDEDAPAGRIELITTFVSAREAT